jgi:inhibitor of cysteine peptidase
MVQVDDTFDGRKVALGAGEMLEVRLSENPSTGHRWTQPEESRSGWTAILRQVDDTFESAGTVPGKSGTRILRFEAIGAGDSDLLLQYRRSWDKDAEPARSFRLHVRVQPAG